jgi:3-phosphoshikimate 1-carboxyvinyltransferase
MGARFETNNMREEAGEPLADLLVKSSPLRAIEISGDMIPRAIDEIPILAVAAAHAEGTTIIRDAKELRVKETDRIKAMVSGLREFGVTVEEFEDGMAITGQQELKGATVSSFGDHRVAMSFVIAGLAASNETRVNDIASIATSFPEFLETVECLAE